MVASLKSNAGVVSEPPSAKLTPPKLILEFANSALAIPPSFIETAPDELTLIAQSTGTGASVLSTKTHSNIITAGHVCYGIISAMSNHTTYTLYDFKGRETNAKIRLIST